MKIPKVAIILINYKWYAKKFLEDCYKSLININYPKDKFRIYIADNKSSEESLRILKELAPEAEIVPSDGNGWGHGNNICAKKAMEQGFDDYFFFVNMDTIFDKDFVKYAIELIEKDKTIGIIQSKILLYPQNKDKTWNVNSRGNSLTFLGFSFCAGDGKVDNPDDDKVVEITTASGAGLLIPREIFLAVNGCDETYFMYHDDVELSQKVRLLGYKIVLQPKSIIYHKHEFSRSVRQIYYIERNRFRFLFEFYKLKTLILIFPMLLFTEIAMIPFEIKNGWFLTKLKVYFWFWNPKNLYLVYQKRKQVQFLRTISDKEFVKNFTATIDFQQIDNFFVKYIANPIFSIYWRIIKKLI